MTHDLPPLPEPREPSGRGARWFTAGQMHAYARAAIAADRAAMPVAQQAQEPDCWGVFSEDGPEYIAPWKDAAHEHINDAIAAGLPEAARWTVQPLYAAPAAPQAPAKALTEERIELLANRHMLETRAEWRMSDLYQFARAIERAHGIGSDK